VDLAIGIELHGVADREIDPAAVDPQLAAALR